MAHDNRRGDWSFVVAAGHSVKNCCNWRFKVKLW